jgi:hypothetical protein
MACRQRLQTPQKVHEQSACNMQGQRPATKDQNREPEHSTRGSVRMSKQAQSRRGCQQSALRAALPD